MKRTQKATYEFKLFESNEIAKYGIMTMASKALSPMQYKTLMYLLWSNLQQTDGDIGFVKVSLSGLCYALGYSKDKNCNFARSVKMVTKIVNDLLSQKLTIYDKDKNVYISFVWIQTVEVSPDEDSILIHFNSDLTRYFGPELKKEFTVVKLKYLNRLTSSAAVILYPFFCRYRNTATLNYRVQDLSRLLTGNPDYQYKYLKRDYLLPAIKSINESTDLSVSMSENKKDRTVTSLRFKITTFPAKKELKYYMDAENVAFDELSICPYDNKWMKDYDYDMSIQDYVPRLPNKGSDYFE